MLLIWISLVAIQIVVVLGMSYLSTLIINEILDIANDILTKFQKNSEKEVE